MYGSVWKINWHKNCFMYSPKIIHNHITVTIHKRSDNRGIVMNNNNEKIKYAAMALGGITYYLAVGGFLMYHISKIIF